MRVVITEDDKLQTRDYFFLTICPFKRRSLKGQCCGVFSAILNEAGPKPRLSAIAHTRNAPRTSRDRYQVKH